MKIKEKHLAENFSRFSREYDNNAFVQRYAAELLLKKIVSVSSPPRSILEIGCGTGFMTERVIKKFPESRFTVCDISQEMLDKCEKNLSGSPALPRFVRANVANIGKEKIKYDLIFSGLAFQWLESELPNTLKNIRGIMDDKGRLLFSTLTAKTFSELKITFAEQNVTFPGPELLSAEEIRKICSDGFSREFKRETYRCSFENALAFLKHIQRTGTGNATGASVPPSALRRIINNYPLRLGRAETEYDIMFCYLKKKR
jgi:malonyl-CoA O-methyltransferase